MAVHVADGAGEVEPEVADVERRERAAAERGAQIGALHQLEHEVDLRGLGEGEVDPRVQQRDETVVVHRREHAGLGLLHRQVARLRGPRREDLHGDVAAEQLVAGAHDDRCAAAADALPEAVPVVQDRGQRPRSGRLRHAGLPAARPATVGGPPARTARARGTLSGVVGRAQGRAATSGETRSRGILGRSPSPHRRGGRAALLEVRMDADVLVVGGGLAGLVACAELTAAGQARAPRRAGGRREPRRAGVVVVRRPVPGGHPRAAAVGDPRLRRARLAGLARQRAVGPARRRGPLGRRVGRGVRRVRRGGEARLAAAAGRAADPAGRLGRARRRAGGRARQLRAPVPPALGHGDRDLGPVRGEGARRGGDGPPRLPLPAPGRRAGRRGRCGDRGARRGARSRTTPRAASRRTGTSSAASRCAPRRW